MLEKIVSKETYSANSKVSQKWEKAMDMYRLKDGKYGAITIKRR